MARANRGEEDEDQLRGFLLQDRDEVLVALQYDEDPIIAIVVFSTTSARSFSSDLLQTW